MNIMFVQYPCLVYIIKIFISLNLPCYLQLYLAVVGLLMSQQGSCTSLDGAVVVGSSIPGCYFEGSSRGGNYVVVWLMAQGGSWLVIEVAGDLLYSDIMAVFGILMVLMVGFEDLEKVAELIFLTCS